MFHRNIQTPRREYDGQRSIFDEIRGVGIADETLSRVFDISSQSKQKLRSKRRGKIVKLRLGILTSFMVVIFFVLTRLIINEFEKYIFLGRLNKLYQLKSQFATSTNVLLINRTISLVFS